MFIGQFEEIAIQVRQAQSVMYAPVGPRTTIGANLMKSAPKDSGSFEKSEADAVP
jgi:hypothetical protein